MIREKRKKAEWGEEVSYRGRESREGKKAETKIRREKKN
jgi:hypothetical protein